MSSTSSSPVGIHVEHDVALRDDAVSRQSPDIHSPIPIRLTTPGHSPLLAPPDIQLVPSPVGTDFGDAWSPPPPTSDSYNDQEVAPYPEGAWSTYPFPPPNHPDSPLPELPASDEAALPDPHAPFPASRRSTGLTAWDQVFEDIQQFWPSEVPQFQQPNTLPSFTSSSSSSFSYNTPVSNTQLGGSPFRFSPDQPSQADPRWFQVPIYYDLDTGMLPPQGGPSPPAPAPTHVPVELSPLVEEELPAFSAQEDASPSFAVEEGSTSSSSASESTTDISRPPTITTPPYSRTTRQRLPRHEAQTATAPADEQQQVNASPQNTMWAQPNPWGQSQATASTWQTYHRVRPTQWEGPSPWYVPLYDINSERAKYPPNAGPYAENTYSSRPFDFVAPGFSHPIPPGSPLPPPPLSPLNLSPALHPTAPVIPPYPVLPGNATYVPQPASYSQSRPFGIQGRRRIQHVPANGSNPFHYELKYPPDPIYEETNPHARIWRTYLDESQMHDTEMVDDSKDNVDVLLVFAGLFSAVVTTFVAQTSQSLQTPTDSVSTSLLYELVNLQRADMNGTSSNSVPYSELGPSSTGPVPRSIIWVNGLWFVSLALSLTTALLSVLVKQWFHQYVAMPSGTPKDRSLLRQYRFSGLQNWHVPIIVGLLPVLMHVAVAIFFAGLIVYIHPLHPTIAYIVFAISGSAYFAYFASQILPVFYPQCPYKTPLSNLISVTLSRIMHWSTAVSPLKEQEMHIVNSSSESVSVDAMHWLYQTSSNPTVRSVVLQAFGGLTTLQTFLLRKKFGDMSDVMSDQESLMSTIVDTTMEGETMKTVLKQEAGAEETFERIVRSMLVSGTMISADFIWPSNTTLEDDVVSRALHAATGRVIDLDAQIIPAPSFLVDKSCFLHFTIWQALAEKIMQTKAIGPPYFTPIPSFTKFDPEWCEKVIESLTHTIELEDIRSENDHIACNIFQAIQRGPVIQDVTRLAISIMFGRFNGLRVQTESKNIRTIDDTELLLAIINYYLSNDYDQDSPSSTGAYASLQRHLVTDSQARSHLSLLHKCTFLMNRILDSVDFEVVKISSDNPLYVFATLRGLLEVNADWSETYVGEIRLSVLSMCRQMFSRSQALFTAHNAHMWCDKHFLTVLVRSSFEIWQQWDPCVYMMWDLMTAVVVKGLQEHIPESYKLFRQQTICESLRRCAWTLQLPIVNMVALYVTEITRQHRTDAENEDLSSAIAYLHTGDNLITVSLILALLPNVIDRRRDSSILRAFAEVCPNHGNWKHCRKTLRLLCDDLKNEQPADHFAPYRSWIACSSDTLQVRLALEAALNNLDEFFEGEGVRQPGGRPRRLSTADALTVLTSLNNDAWRMLCRPRYPKRFFHWHRQAEGQPSARPSS